MDMGVSLLTQTCVHAVLRRKPATASTGPGGTGHDCSLSGFLLLGAPLCLSGPWRPWAGPSCGFAQGRVCGLAATLQSSWKLRGPAEPLSPPPHALTPITTQLYLKVHTS